MAYQPPINGRGFVTIGGNTSGASSMISSGTVGLVGGNNITLSQNNGNAITIIGGAGGGGGANTFGMSNLTTVGGATSGTSGTINGTAVQLAFAAGNNITLSQSINVSSATITISAQPTFDAGISNLGNTSGTSGSNTNGLYLVGGNNVTLSQSTNATGAFVTISGGAGIVFSGGGSSFTSGTVNLVAAAGGALTVSGTSNSISLSVPAQSTIVGTNGLSVSDFGSTVSVGMNLPRRWHEIALQPMFTNITTLTGVNGVPMMQPYFNGGNLSISRMQVELSRVAAGSNRFTVFAGIYSYINDTQISLMASLSNSYSNTLTASASGVQRIAMSGFNVSTFAPGEYVVGLMFTVGAASTASMNYAIRGGYTATPHAGFILPGTDIYNTNASANGVPFFGRYSTTSAAMPVSFAQSQIVGQFAGASLPINYWVGFQNY